MYVSLNFPSYDKLNYAGIVIGSYGTIHWRTSALMTSPSQHFAF